VIFLNCCSEACAVCEIVLDVERTVANLTDLRLILI